MLTYAPCGGKGRPEGAGGPEGAQMRSFEPRLRRTGFRPRIAGVAGAMVLLPVLLLLVFVFAVSASARTFSPSAAAVAGCPTAKVLNTGGSNSNFEIDTNANLKVDGAAPCIDWLSGGSGTGFRSGTTTQQDLPSG